MAFTDQDRRFFKTAFQKLASCSNSSNSSVEISTEQIVEAIQNLQLENENNLKCSKSFLCTQDCQTIQCRECWDVEGNTVIKELTTLDGLVFSGDILNLDPDCSKCNDGATNCISTEKVCWVDNVNGDFTSLVPYTQIVCIQSDGSLVEIGNYNSNFSGPYTPSNGVSPDSVGLPASGKAGRETQSSGESWSPGGLVKSFTVHPKEVGVTFTDSYGVVTIMDEGISETWSWDDAMSDTAPVVTGAATIIWTSF